MENFTLSEVSEVRSAQIKIIRDGMQSIHPDEPSLTEDDFASLELGQYDNLSIKGQYWVARYYHAGQSLKDKEASRMDKMYKQPATIGNVTAIAHDMIYGKGGIGEQLLNQIASLQSQLAILGEALRLKVGLTAEELDEATVRLVKKETAEVDASLNTIEAPQEQPSEEATITE